MTFEELKNKAHSLPAEPGVYIMRNEQQEVIYVGKAKKLRNRVSSYFVDSSSHNIKTRTMISKIHDFDVIVAASEFEALVLESSLIKRHIPRYNILLKDDKGYPYIRLDLKKEYPVLSVVGKISNDGAAYFGPYGSRKSTNNLLDALCATLKLPRCSKKFPDDFGKARPCLHYHMHQCAGWCKGNISKDDYLKSIAQVKSLLQGDYKKVSNDIKKDMIKASEELDFELAAVLRDRMKSLEALNSKQLVTANARFDMDVIGYHQNESKACFAVLHFSEGNLIDKDFELLPVSELPEETMSSIVVQYYAARRLVPKKILLPFKLDDIELIEQYLRENYNDSARLNVPQRGDLVYLTKLACKNAVEEVNRVTTKEEHISGVLNLLGKTLSMNAPKRIESYDISNISGTDIVGSMVVFLDGKPCKSQYKKFKIRDLADQDDYESMRQMLERRIERFKADDAGFNEIPDLLLIDGGGVHAALAWSVLQAYNLNWPVFGMVKDDRHRTRALVTPSGEIIAIDRNQSLFSFIGTIQEETHRFAINYHKTLRSKRLQYSELDQIPGVGPKRKQELLRTFKSLSSIRAASLEELERILPKPTALAVLHYFNSAKEQETCE